MSLFYREDTGQAWENFDALRQQALTTLGAIDRMLSRLATNQMPINLEMLQDFQATINAQKTWWANLKEREPGQRRFRIVSRGPEAWNDKA